MAKEEALRVIYQLHILLLKISPAIWRRVLVPSDQNLADFHDTLQILMGWDDTHLHRFLIHGKAYGVTRDGGLCFSDNPKQARLNNLHLRIKERFPLILPKSIPGVLVERARHRQHGAMGRWPTSNKSSIFPSGTLVVVFSKSLRMKKRVWVITRRKLPPCSSGCKRRRLIVRQSMTVSPSSPQVINVG